MSRYERHPSARISFWVPLWQKREELLGRNPRKSALQAPRLGLRQSFESLLAQMCDNCVDHCNLVSLILIAGAVAQTFFIGDFLTAQLLPQRILVVANSLHASLESSYLPEALLLVDWQGLGQSTLPSFLASRVILMRTFATNSRFVVTGECKIVLVLLEISARYSLHFSRRLAFLLWLYLSNGLGALMFHGLRGANPYIWRQAHVALILQQTRYYIIAVIITDW